MARQIGLFCVVSLCTMTAIADGQVSYTYGAKVLGAKVHFVFVNPIADDLQITPVYVSGGAPFETMVCIYRPIVAINGTFFHQRTKHPIGDVVIDGSHVHKGKLRTALIMQGPFAVITTIPAMMDFTGKVGNTSSEPVAIWSRR